MDQFISSTGLERVTLAKVYFHFVGLSPSERQAAIDLVSAIREGLLELRAGEVTEFRPDGNQITYNTVVPEAALADQLGTEFDFELSRVRWRRLTERSKRQRITFEQITVSRDQVLKLRPVSAATIGSAAKRRGGLAPQFDWGVLVAITLSLLEDEGWPDIKSQREFANKICDAYAEAGMDPVPAPSTVREKLSLWLSKRRPR